MIAVVAGTGTLPIKASQRLLELNEKFFVLSLFPEDNFKQLNDVVAGKIEIIAQEFYKAGEILDLIKQRGTKKVLFIGKVDKQHLLQHIKFDWFAVKLMASLVSKSDSSVMERILSELQSHGIDVMRQDEILGSLIVAPGILCGSVDEPIKSDIQIGMHVATQLSCCDIGQTVVVKDKMVLAVEAIEGTDLCIKRGIDLGKSDVVVCKSARETQNRKFDLPTLGPASLANLEKGQVKAIAWLSKSTFIAQREEFVKRAQDLGITLVSVE